jgi:Protein of unknown function (DUF2795)
MATNTAPSLQRYLDDASFPVAKADLLTRAREAGLPSDDLAMLGRLPEQTYMTPVDVSLAMSEQQGVKAELARTSRTPRRPATQKSTSPSTQKSTTARSKTRPTPNVRSEATQATNRIATRVTGVAKEQLESRKGEATTQLSRAAKSLRKNEQQFRSSGDALLADVASAGATGLEQATDFLRTQDVDAISETVKSAVRRRPAVAVGIALAVGFLGARFLKAGMGGPPPAERPKNQNER